jgi:hypothetical protein
MEMTTKYPIVSTVEGLTLKSYRSPIIDEGFHLKF